jgi:hypothetical protein
MTAKDATGKGSRWTAEHTADKRDVRSLIRAELDRITERFDAADRRAKRATTIEDREAAEAERQDAAAEFWAASADLADLFLLLFRHATKHQPDALRAYIVALLRPELDPIAQAIANLEGRV